MGFLNPIEIIDGNIDLYKERQVSPYNALLSATPTKCTYYRQDVDNTTMDLGTLDVEAIIGADSPVKFSKIEDFVYYGGEKIQFSLENEADGGGIVKAGMEFEIVVLPDTIRPIPGDFLSISYLNSNYFFKVTHVDIDTIKAHNFYKATVSFSKIVDLTTFETEQVTSTNTFIYDNIGTDYKVIIRTDEMEFVKEITEIYDMMKRYYMDLFFSEKARTFVVEDVAATIYNTFMIKFISEHKLFLEERNPKTLVLMNDIKVGREFNIEYDKTIYNAIVKRNKSVSPLTHSIFSPIRGGFSWLAQYKELYHNLSMLLPSDNPLVGSNIVIRVLDDELFTCIADGTALYPNGVLGQSICDYFNNKSITSTTLQALREYEYQHDMRTFMLVPLVLFVIKNNLAEILKVKQ